MTSRHLAAVLIHAGEHKVLVVLRITGAGRRIGADPFAPLDEQPRQKAARLVERDAAVRQIPPQIRLQHPVDTADARPDPGQPGERERAPDALHRLAEVARRQKRHAAHPLGVLRQHVRQRRNVAFLPDMHGTHGVLHAVQHGTLPFVRRLCQPTVDPFFQPVDADLQHRRKIERQVRQPPCGGASAERGGNGMADRQPQRSRAADRFLRADPQRRLLRDPQHGCIVALLRVHVPDPVDIIQRHSGRATRLVPVLPGERPCGELPRRLVEAHRTRNIGCRHKDHRPSLLRFTHSIAPMQPIFH